MKLRYIEDYYDKIQERFPDLELWEIDKILKHGMQSFATLHSRGADVLISSPKLKFVMYVGSLFNRKDLFYKYSNLKWKIKYRIQYWSKNKVWDGNYYFALTEDEYSKDLLDKAEIVGDIKLMKIKEEAILPKKKKYLFKITGLEDTGHMVIVERLSTKNITLVATKNENGKIIYKNE